MIKIFKIAIVIFFFILFSCKKENNTHPKEISSFDHSPVTAGSMQPFLFAKNDQIFMSWTQKKSDSLYGLNFASFSEGKWSNGKEIGNGSNWFINWADFPSIVKNGSHLLVHHLQKSDNATYAYDIRLNLSNDNGENWHKDFMLHNDGTKTEHGFVTMLPYEKDSFMVTWLDGRNTESGTGHGENDQHQSKGAMNLRAAKVLSTGKIIDDTLIDEKTCDCCQTSTVITEKGPFIVYRDRSDEEIRDIYFSRMVDGSWTIPQPVYNDNWVINGCPVNGPKADAKDNTVVVAWFTAAGNIPKVNIAFSVNNGKGFDQPIQIDLGSPIGRVDIALIDEENALVSWVESTEDDANFMALKVNRNGKKNNVVLLSEISASRASGFPQLELMNDTVFLAWNHIFEDQIIIKTKSIPISTFN
ncbi:MAG: hypothetical protein KJO83_03230 [Bacteroidia bacterium]|nr:hypothetical protein [Bacteroidia bacterium]